MTEQDEVAELEAARERNDLDIRDLREMSVKELREVGARLDIDAGRAERREELVDRILQRQTERAGLDYAFGILDIVDEGYGFMRRHGLLPSPDDVYVIVEPGPALRAARRRPGHRRRARAARGREVLGPDPGRHASTASTPRRPAAARTSAT